MLENGAGRSFVADDRRCSSRRWCMAQRQAGEASRASAFAGSSLAFARAWLLPLALGVAAATLEVKIPLQLPGRNGLIWMSCLVAGRLASGNAVGGLVAGAGAFAGSIGGEVTSAIGFLAAGGVIDLLAPTSRWLRLGWAALAGTLGNLSILAVKLLAGQPPTAAATRGMSLT